MLTKVIFFVICLSELSVVESFDRNRLAIETLKQSPTPAIIGTSLEIVLVSSTRFDLCVWEKFGTSCNFVMGNREPSIRTFCTKFGPSITFWVDYNQQSCNVLIKAANLSYAGKWTYTLYPRDSKYVTGTGNIVLIFVQLYKRLYPELITPVVRLKFVS